MSPPSVTVRAAAARSVSAVVGRGQALDEALAGFETDTAEGDRGLLHALAYGTIRHWFSLSAAIDAMTPRPLGRRDLPLRALIAVGLFQLSAMRIPDHAAVAETVAAASALGRSRQKGLVNALLRRAIRDRASGTLPRDDEARFDHPRWLIDAIGRDWPDDRDRILAANNARAPMWLRVNLRLTSLSDYRQELAGAGMDGHPVPGLDAALRLASPVSVAELPGYADGRVSVQDGAAQLAAPWLLAGRRGRILDACAAPGGKGAHIKERGAGDVALTSVEIDAGRAGVIRQNFERLKLDATVLTGDASKPETWWDGEPFQGILLDAPCSASGVIRRHPDIKLLRRPGDIAALATRQRLLLDALWPLLAPGGRLLYVTCSVLAAENDAVVAGFLAGQPEAAVNDVLHANNIHDLMRRKTHGFQILPGTAEMDGFYYACLDRPGDCRP